MADKILMEQKMAEIEGNPSIAWELVKTQGKTIKSLIIALCMSIALMVALLGGVLWFANNYEITATTSTIEQQISGDTATIVNDGQYNDNAIKNSYGGEDIGNSKTD